METPDGQFTSLLDSLKEEIVDTNPEFAIQFIKFNISGSLLAIVENEQDSIKIINVPDGKKVTVLQPNYNGSSC